MEAIISKMRVFVPCNDHSKRGLMFPRLRLIAVLRALYENMPTAIKLIDVEWPRVDDNDDRMHYTKYYGEWGNGIIVTLITDDAGVGRVSRAVYTHKTMDLRIVDIERLSEVNTFAHRGGKS